MHPRAQAILESECNRLFQQAQRIVPSVKVGNSSSTLVGEDQRSAALIRDYILAQEFGLAEDFRLPEPILHPVYPMDILVVGLNPNDGPYEYIPRRAVSKSRSTG